MREGWNIIIRYDEDLYGFKLWFIKRNHDGSIEYIEPVNPMVTHRTEIGATFPEPTIRVTGMDARGVMQDLVNALVASDFRPDEIKTLDKVLQATRDHLEDMRTLVFQALLPPEIPPPRLGVDKR